MRFLQDLSYRPLGAQRDEQADIRIIAATNSDLAALVEANQFRQDLYYRLHVLSLPLPPLRERYGDPELLAVHFVRAASLRFHCPEKCLDPASIPLLNAYRWPGNIRELENLIQRELLLRDGPMVSLQSLERLRVDDRASPAKLTDAAFRVAKADAIARFERAYIAELLSRTDGNISLAARLSGKERCRLGKLAKKYGLQRAEFARGP